MLHSPHGRIKSLSLFATCDVMISGIGLSAATDLEIIQNAPATPLKLEAIQLDMCCVSSVIICCYIGLAIFPFTFIENLVFMSHILQRGNRSSVIVKTKCCQLQPLNTKGFCKNMISYFSLVQNYFCPHHFTTTLILHAAHITCTSGAVDTKVQWFDR